MERRDTGRQAGSIGHAPADRFPNGSGPLDGGVSLRQREGRNTHQVIGELFRAMNTERTGRLAARALR
jgi:hypothetical protein